MKFTSVIFLMLLIVLIYGCSKNSIEDKKLSVSTSLVPYADVIKQIGKDKVLVNVLIEPGQNAHTFEFTPAKLRNVENTKIYFRVGKVFNIENTILPKITDFNKNLKIVDCSSGISIQNNNPHVWLSPKLMMKISANIAAALISADKKNESYYKENLETFLRMLKSEDSLMSEMTKNKLNKIFVVYHAAWQYFAADYGIQEIAIEDEGKSPQMKSMKEKIQQLKKINIKTIFADQQFDSLPVETIAKSIGAKVDFVNPLPSDYIKNLSEIRNKLDKSMN